MATETVRIVATLKAWDGMADEMRALLKSLVEPSRAEPGCIQYDLLESLDDPTEFVFVEEWRDAEALQAHSSSDRFRTSMGRLPGLLAGRPTLRRCRLVA